MRIISGKCKGRKLLSISGRDIRPTSDRIRESIFNIIAQKVKGTVVLDLFAGTGALGIEALSRGAEHAFFIDISDRALDVVKGNIIKCNIINHATLIHRDITKRSSFALINRKIDLVFMDPPYSSGLIFKALKQVVSLDYLADNALIIAEHSIKEKISHINSGLDIKDQRKYGRTLITFLQKRQGIAAGALCLG